MVALIQSRSLEFHLKQTFKTCQFNESRFFYRIKPEHNSSEKKQTDACFMDDALKARGIKHLNVETRLLFPPALH